MSLDINITITGDDLIRSAADGVLARGDEIQRAEVGSFGKRYLKALQDETPRGRGEERSGGRLVDSYREEEMYSQSAASYRITNEKEYLRWVLEGRPAIEAKPGRMLRFVIDGQVLYRRRVGPAAANPFDSRVADAMRSDGDALGERVAGRVMRVFEER